MRFLPVPDAPLATPPTHSTRAVLAWLLRRAAAMRWLFYVRSRITVPPMRQEFSG